MPQVKSQSAVSSSTESLNPQQQLALQHLSGPLLILAGAGTGKTRVITHRIARLIETGADPRRILAVTFTHKAAQEMRRRVDHLCPGKGAAVWIFTFHSFCNRLLRQNGRAVGLPPYFTLYDEEDQKKLILECLKELGWEDQKNKASLYLALIARAKDDLLDAQSYAIHSAVQKDPHRETVARIYLRYQQKLEKLGAADFGDLLLKTVRLLKENEAICRHYQTFFQHISIDEYQDTNRAQYVLAKILAEKHRNLCVVGDDDQSIYLFRGADIRNILEFEKDFPGAFVVTLEQNYRSTQKILDAAWRIIHQNENRKPKRLWTEKKSGEPISLLELATEYEEGRAVASEIQNLLQNGAAPKDAAIFYRTNAQSRSFEEALRRCRIPYRLIGTVRFYERKEIKDALSYARVLINPSDSLSLSRILNVPRRNIGNRTQEILRGWCKEKEISLWEALGEISKISGLTPCARKALQSLCDLLKTLQSHGPQRAASEAMAEILDRSGYLQELEEEAQEDPQAAGRLANLQELLNAMKEFEEQCALSGGDSTLGAYLEQVALEAAADSYSEKEDSVTLMTVHLAKGLEFPIVFLTGMEEGLFPIGSAGHQPKDLEEERRLCYVGMTRAKEKLILTYSDTRRIFGQTYYNLPSRFIEEAGLAQPSVPEAPLPAKASPRNLIQLRLGSRVRHPQFGEGQVAQLIGGGESLKVKVVFEDGRWRKFLVQYAPLEIL
ncbi:MAG: UvrD-helicase domain-containing protein [Elusimicrobia bacterium]|nr:UvrD-helicase domain-containing protein [Elusimicrobiota bacterium]